MSIPADGPARGLGLAASLGLATSVLAETPEPDFDCLCEVISINPNQVTLNKVASGAKQALKVREFVMQVRTVDAPGKRCDIGDISGPVPIHLWMVDDDGDVLVDNAKNFVCDGGHGGQQKVTRRVAIRGPLNCADSAVPSPPPAGNGSSVGLITVTGSAPGSPDYVEDIRINCNEWWREAARRVLKKRHRSSFRETRETGSRESYPGASGGALPWI